jgi:hypothetical protein
MKFSSTVDVVNSETNELFNTVEIYVPLSKADANLTDFDPAWVSADKPAVMVCTVDNYKKYMKGKLLDQWTDFFRQDTNVDGILIVVVFLDGAATESMWAIDDVSITFEPLTKAFKKLFSNAYFKTLFDESYDGAPVTVAAYPGTPGRMLTRFTNTNGFEVIVPAGTYTMNDGVKDWAYTSDEPLTFAPGEHLDIEITALTTGTDANLQDGSALPFTDVAAAIVPALPSGFTAIGQSSTQGTNPTSGPTTVPSKYFDTALALAYQC